MIDYRTNAKREADSAAGDKVLWEQFLKENPELVAKCGDLDKDAQSLDQALARVDLAMKYSDKFL